jgi:N-acetyl-alpha-D-muramate 1-phosphate uridylyltransferase
MDAVVMAAGEGRRLRPLTERWPKTLLPIDGRPVMATLLRELASAGFREATIVVGYLGEQVQALIGDGSGFGLSIHYAEQPEALGSADAVGRALAAGAEPPLLVTAADTVYRPGDVGLAARAWAESGTSGGVGVRVDSRPDRTPVRAAGGRLLAFGEDDGSGLSGAPLWFLDEGMAAALGSLPGPPFALGDALTNALSEGREIAALELGPTRDLTRPTDVILGNFPYLWSSG